MRPPSFLRLCTLSMAACTLQTGCSIITPMPLWELVKAAGGLASTAVSSAAPEARNTLYHLRSVPSDVCIEFNPQNQVPDLVPVLQAELQSHGVSSKVYDNPPAARLCNIWLEYTAYFDWGVTPLTGELRPYMSSAQLALRSKSGELLSSSQFQLDIHLAKGKWSDTRTKLSPVVAALVTGY
ncbi:cell division protein FtsI [Comamonas sp. GB3 AK4-5]|uniref:cell division protein FtsI n=1 Tax=Comamonas sp. GB3 AK4-5 TaxID=3231487 RepID=UPI00351F1FB5